MKTKLFLLLAIMLWGIMAFSQTPDFISDSMAHLFQSGRLDSTTLAKMVMTTDGMGDYQHISPNPALTIALIEGPDMMRILDEDTSAYKIILLWSCWSKHSIAEMMANKYLYNADKYALYLVSADLNNNRQRDTISRFLTSLGISKNAYQINSAVTLSDLQNSKATATFIDALTGTKQQMRQLNVCMNFPYAIIYDRTNKIVRTFDGHFSLSELAKYRSTPD